MKYEVRYGLEFTDEFGDSGSFKTEPFEIEADTLTEAARKAVVELERRSEMLQQFEDPRSQLYEIIDEDGGRHGFQEIMHILHPDIRDDQS